MIVSPNELNHHGQPEAKGRLDFLIAGVQRAGTTALYSALLQHPSVCLPRQKELHFFDDEQADWSAPDYRGLHSRFSPRNGDARWGEATPIYTYWVPSAERIHRYNPGIRLIVLLRNPIERAYSHWRMEISARREHLAFSEAIRAGRARILSSKIAGCHRVYSYVERGFYASQIRRLLSLFDRSQLLLIETEDFRLDRSAVLKRICDFLQIESDVQPFGQVLGEPAGPFTPQLPPACEVDYLKAIFKDNIIETSEISGLDLSRWVQ